LRVCFAQPSHPDRITSFSWFCSMSVSSRAFLYPTLPSGKGPRRPVPERVPFAPFLRAARLLYEGPWVAERYLAVRPPGGGGRGTAVAGTPPLPRRHAPLAPVATNERTEDSIRVYMSQPSFQPSPPLPLPPPPRAPPPRLVDERPDALLLVTRDILLRGTRGRAGITVARPRHALFAPKRQEPSLGVNFAVRIFPASPRIISKFNP